MFPFLKKNKEKTSVSSITTKQNFSFEIIFAGLSILVFAVMIVTGYSYINNKSAILGLSEEIIDQINQRVFQNARNYLMTAVDMTELSSRITGEGVEELHNNPRLDSLMIAILKLHPQLKNFEIGNENGDFLMQRREPDGTISTKSINRHNGKTTVKWKYRDKEGNIIREVVDPNDDYDPRSRPWYLGAKKEGELFWSDVYVFKTDKIPGVTASSPVLTKNKQLKGVFGLDIPLNNISEFLKTLKEELKDQKIGKSSIVFIVNSKDEIVAYPDPSIPMIEENGRLRPRKVKELDIAPQVVETFQYYKDTKDNSFNIKVDGKKYLASYKEFPKSDSTKDSSGSSFNIKKDWTIGLVVREDDLIGPIKATNRMLITVSLVILMGAIVLGLIMLKIKKALDVRSRFIKETFGKYLSDEIVENILETPSGTVLGGDKRIVTIMMTDLRGFTSIGERLPAESVVQMINNYLDIMTDVIFKYNGTIDEFIGDAILVIFGAPIQRPDDAKRAIACATEMQLAMDEVNRRNREAGFPEVHMGIGLNTGEIVVGNIGSSKRMKYGVVGKNVNLTSRIESYTVGGQIMVGPSVIQAAGDDVRIDDQFEVMPKGVNAPITISSVGGIGGEYKIYLPEKKDRELKVLKSKVEMEFSVLAGKHAGDSTHIAKISQIVMEEALLEAKISVEKLNN
ncbi:MAG: hypothetical protein KDK36_14805, partial [Leptospiraceae bacterium]|nr:hypothetical protein [Leptospiraceae bacterium]